MLIFPSAESRPIPAVACSNSNLKRRDSLLDDHPAQSNIEVVMHTA